jgi:hypothetical protein
MSRRSLNACRADRREVGQEHSEPECFTNLFGGSAPKGRNRIAQGFNPGYRVAIGCDLKASPARYAGADWARAGYSIRELDDVHQLWCPFRACRCRTPYPGLKPWAVLLRPFGAYDEYEDDKSGGTPHP